MADQRERADLRRRIYGESDLGALSVFAGGYINFGYWRDIPLDRLTRAHRIASEEALYDVVFDAVGLTAGDRLVEVGCGQGLGARRATLHRPGRVCGVDLLSEQVTRARAGGGEFMQGAADDLPLPDDSFDRVISVEAAQHFEDLAGFARESMRVLAPGGTLAVTTFFGERPDELAELLETFASGLDLAHPIEGFLADLREAGFTDVLSVSVGEHVWNGLDRWLVAAGRGECWDRNWKTAADLGLVDYHLITARKPAGSGG
ncbi:methyltransferase domain-containing protein [Actinosynnema sp. NPDC020468]|uniref:class I SAM-dependent methyltransferase n=1 Tax=Actinosynnema sp. NPDC020468 TaxID=3154488 RepID=UPI0033CEDD24